MSKIFKHSENEATHPIFKNRPKDEDYLWRYMDISKLNDIVNNNNLYFSRIDKFDDHFEGTWLKKDYEHLKDAKGFNIVKYTHDQHKKVAVSCWHHNNNESAAMWKLYNSDNNGLAIVTTCKQLVDAMSNLKNEKDIFLSGIASVQYRDSFNDSLIKNGKPTPNTLMPFILKNHAYNFEREVRALIICNDPLEIEPAGYKVNIEPDKLINEIIINPLASQIFKDHVFDILSKDMHDKVKNSSLSLESFYMR